MEIRDRILQQAELLFMHAGIRSVTMDDISRQLGMSKKTLYQHFRNKAEIVQAVMAGHMKSEIRECESIAFEAKDPVQELILLMRWMRKTWEMMPSNIIFEVQKYYPRAWSMFDEFKNGFIFNAVRTNLEAGIQQGLYRPEINIEIITKLRIASIEAMVNPLIFPPEQYPPSEVHVSAFELFIHGLVTMKGKELIEKYLKEMEAA